MSKSKIEKRLPEPQHSKEQNSDTTSVRPAIAKPIVVRSPNFLSTEKTVEEVKEGRKNEYGRLVLNETGKVIGVESAIISEDKDLIVAKYGKDGMTYFTGEFTPLGEAIFSKFPNKE